MKKPRALLYGKSFDLAFAMPSLLNRSGFEVDIIFNNSIFKKSRFVKNLDVIDEADFIKTLQQKDLEVYSLIVPCDDEIIKIVVDSELAVEKK